MGITIYLILPIISFTDKNTTICDINGIASFPYYTYTKKTFYDYFEGWLNEEVMASNFETHTHNYATLETKKLQYPKLYMCYKED